MKIFSRSTRFLLIRCWTLVADNRENYLQVKSIDFAYNILFPAEACWKFLTKLVPDKSEWKVQSPKSSIQVWVNENFLTAWMSRSGLFSIPRSFLSIANRLPSASCCVFTRFLELCQRKLFSLNDEDSRVLFSILLSFGSCRLIRECEQYLSCWEIWYADAQHDGWARFLLLFVKINICAIEIETFKLEKQTEILQFLVSESIESRTNIIASMDRYSGKLSKVWREMTENSVTQASTPFKSVACFETT